MESDDEVYVVGQREIETKVTLVMTEVASAGQGVTVLGQWKTVT